MIVLKKRLWHVHPWGVSDDLAWMCSTSLPPSILLLTARSRFEPDTSSLLSSLPGSLQTTPYWTRGKSSLCISGGYPLVLNRSACDKESTWQRQSCICFFRHPISLQCVVAYCLTDTAREITRRSSSNARKVDNLKGWAGRRASTREAPREWCAQTHAWFVCRSQTVFRLNKKTF